MLSAANQVFAAEFVFSVANVVFAVEFVLSATNQVFTAEFVSFAANHVFTAELCCPQQSDSGFRRGILWLAAKRIRCSLPNLCCPPRIRWWLLNFDVRSESVARCQICVVRSKSGICCRIMLSAAKRIRCSLSNCVFREANQVFAAEFVLSAAN